MPPSTTPDLQSEDLQSPDLQSQDLQLELQSVELQPTAVSEPRSRASRVARLLLLLPLAAVMLFPIWSVPQPPLLDYPNHLARIFVLTHLHDPSYGFSHYFSAVWGPYPYVGMDLMLIATQYVMPLEIAGKLL